MLDRYREVLKDIEHRYLYEDIQYRRGLALFGLSRFNEALPSLREAVSFSYDHAADEQQVHFALGVCLEDAKDTEAAKQEFNRVIGFGLKNDVEERACMTWRCFTTRPAPWPGKTAARNDLTRVFKSESCCLMQAGI
jgi:tetratricopeptide (TPR) repeat protein